MRRQDAEANGEAGPKGVPQEWHIRRVRVRAERAIDSHCSLANFFAIALQASVGLFDSVDIRHRRTLTRPCRGTLSRWERERSPLIPNP